jgi:pilus assembly protein Flp/PilA
MNAMLSRLVGEEEGQDLIEYALLAAFIGLAALVGVTALGTSLSGFFSKVGTKVDTMPLP